MSNEPSLSSGPEGTLMKSFRRFTGLLIPPSLMLVVLLMLMEQFTEIQDRNELLTATVVVALVSLSALAFSWARCLPENLLKIYGETIHGAGVDLFIASLPALISAFLIWIKLPPTLEYTVTTLLVFSLQWFFLLIALVYSLLALMRLLKVALQMRK
jgi:hypothetical protein